MVLFRCATSANLILTVSSCVCSIVVMMICVSENSLLMYRGPNRKAFLQMHLYERRAWFSVIRWSLNLSVGWIKLMDGCDIVV